MRYKIFLLILSTIPLNLIAGNITFFKDKYGLDILQSCSFSNENQLDSICQLVDHSLVTSIELHDADQLLTLPHSFFRFIKIECLTITSYTLTAIDSNFNLFTNLEEFRFHCYAISSIDSTIRLPSKLKVVSCVVTKAEIFNLFCESRVKHLLLDLYWCNEIEIVDKIKCFNKLKYLSVSNFPFDEQAAKELFDHFDKIGTTTVIWTVSHKKYSNDKFNK